MIQFPMFSTSKLTSFRKQIYFDNGFLIFKKFLPKNVILRIQEFWRHDHSYQFSSFIKNRDVSPGCRDYVYNRPTAEDFSYCVHLWNKPFDEELHETAYRIQTLRNILEGKPLYHGLHEATGKYLQYRICKTISEGQAVYKHADFMEETRADPAGNHSFDPIRLQATLFLSDYGNHYDNGGFFLYDSTDQEKQLFGKDIPVNAGDLVFWRYSLSHEISGVTALDRSLGFLRVIYPLFDLKEPT
ncbi:MAG: hypothetical protein VW421_00795 [Gammaproteobacteria bacterium]